MNTRNKIVRTIGRPALLALSAAAFSLIAPAPTACAQEGGPPSPEEIQQKIREIEKLMKKAEQALARSTASRESAEKAARRLEELLNEKAQEQTGKSSEQLRKEAKEGSSASAEALRKLTEEARSEAAEASAGMAGLLGEGGNSTREASEGVRKLIEKTMESGKEAGDGIQWLLKNAVSSSSSGGGGGQSHKPPMKEPKPEKPGEEPKDGEKKEEKPSETAKPPKSDRDPPRNEKFVRWIADLPPQVRRAYESRDWDAIPVKWRSIMRDWTKKMADELDQERR